MDARSAARVAAIQAIYELGLNPDAVTDAKFLGKSFDEKRVK